MTIKDRLLKSGAIINTRETDFGQHKKKVEVWFRKDSEALRDFVRTLICQFAKIDMRCSVQPYPLPHKNMASVWQSQTDEQYISAQLDIADVAEYGTTWKMPLKALLAELHKRGPKECMAFLVTMDWSTWQTIIERSEREAAKLLFPFSGIFVTSR